jgi:two-component system sensor histidine kinase NblS
MNLNSLKKQNKNINEEKDNFISDISHELKTPLFNIKSFIETLYEFYDTLDYHEHLEFLRIIIKETNRLNRLINDLLELSSLETKKIYIFSYININKIVYEIINLNYIIIKKKKITFFLEKFTNLPLVYTNHDLFFQILINLISNSLKFTFNKGSVGIRIYIIEIDNSLTDRIWKPKNIYNKQIRIEISDSGIGITKNNCNYIFEKFIKIENKIHTIKGTGLGLALVKNIIKNHDSEIYLYSEYMIGTTFWFDFKINNK